MDIDFDKLVLTDDEKSFLLTLQTAGTWVHESKVPDSVEPYNLIDLGLVEILDENAPEDFFMLSETGHRYLLYLSRSKKAMFWKEFRNWVSFGVSISAFFLSILALYLQYTQS